MADNKSAIKRHKQNRARRLRNKSHKSEVKTSIKKFLEAAKKGDKAAAEKLYVETQKLIDTAAQKGVYHRNNASRKKSRLSHVLAKVGAVAEKA